MNDERPRKQDAYVKEAKKVKILLVEDVAMVAKITTILLERRGWHVDWVATGKAAIEQSSVNYDVMLLDLGLPDVDGYEVAQAIRHRDDPTATMPIIALTAHDDDDVTDQAKASGIDATMAKPLSATHCDGLAEMFLKNEARR